MKREQLMMVWLAGGLFLSPAARAVGSGDNPYKSIIDRNPFGLIPPPPPVPVETVTPPSNLKLTGITTILGSKSALLMAQEPGPAGKNQSYILTEGQREGQIEILAIDSIAGSVKVSNAGIVSTLTFDKDGLKAPPAAAPAPAGMPGVPGIPVPGAIPGRPGMPTGGFTPIPTGGGAIPGAVPANPGGGLRQIPTRSLRMPQSSAQLGQPTATATTPAATPAPVSPEVQAILMEAHRHDPGMPPMPPIPGMPSSGAE